MFRYSDGAEIIKDILKNLSSSAGVYRMIGEKDDVLYVGKAKNLRNRVSNYINPSGLNSRIMAMVAATRRMEIVETKTEAEALLLECNLIKSLKPRYNILLRDDKSFPYIHFTAHPSYPQITKFRGAVNNKGQYFGPFASVQAVNHSLTILQRAFLLRPCADTIFKNRTRPCLQYQIKRCSAPCVGYVSEAEYRTQMDQAIRFLKGKSREVQEEFARQMQVYSEAMEYEKAASMRDRIKALTTIQQQQRLAPVGVEDADVIALYREGDKCCVQVFFFRGGQNFGNQPFFPRAASDATEAEILSAFIGQFYQTHAIPKLILTNLILPDADLLEEAFALHADRKVEISAPLRGDKKDIIEQALHNAKQALLARLSEQASTRELLEGVAELFGLDETPERIEVYDNSHISGTHAVGAMIVATPDGFAKKQYRRFNFRSTELTPGDDYAMMREVFTRRFQRLQKEDPDRTQNLWPSLILIDGGVGQLNAVTQIMNDLGVSDLAYVAISKGPDRNAGREWFHRSDKEPFQVEKNHPVLHYLQRLRDEAHRFAIGSHRMKRAKAMHASPLDEISGIGASRKKALLLHFGSAKGVEAASLEELESVQGVSKQIARKIYDHFHSA